MKSEVKHILEAVRDGDMSIDDALLKLKTKPYEDIGFAKTDLHRKVQQGIPEVIYGAGKTARQMRREDYSRWRAILEPLQAALPKLAEETGAVFVPLQKPFEDACKLRPASYWIWDGIHPTVSGHALLAREWEKAALPLLLSQR